MVTEHPLAAARAKAGLSQEALGKMVGRDRLTILRIENRQVNPPLKTVNVIINALRQKNIELSADDFLPAPATEKLAS